MILQNMTDEELNRITPLVEVHIPEIETRTGLRRKIEEERHLFVTDFHHIRLLQAP